MTEYPWVTCGFEFVDGGTQWFADFVYADAVPMTDAEHDGGTQSFPTFQSEGRPLQYTCD